MHVLLEMAQSVVARSRLREAAEARTPDPDTWATGAAGTPTTDARFGMAGLIEAIGGTKGARLALCLDLMAAVLSGAAMLTEIPDAASTPERPQRFAQMLLLIDARKLLPQPDGFGRIATAARMVGTCPAVDPAMPPRLPGARAIAALRKAQSAGLDLPAPLLAGLSARAGA